jgi:hypothetical protein
MTFLYNLKSQKYNYNVQPLTKQPVSSDYFPKLAGVRNVHGNRISGDYNICEWKRD